MKVGCPQRHTAATGPSLLFIFGIAIFRGDFAAGELTGARFAAPLAGGDARATDLMDRSTVSKINGFLDDGNDSREALFRLFVDDDCLQPVDFRLLLL